MNPTLSNLFTSNSNHSYSLYTSTSLQRIICFLPNPKPSSSPTPFNFNSPAVSPKRQLSKQLRSVAVCSSDPRTTFHGSITTPRDSSFVDQYDCEQANQWRSEIRSPVVLPFGSSLASRFSPGDRVFFLLAFIACTTSVAFTSLVVAAVPTLFAMSRAATSLAKLADTIREELPSTMAAIRLSSMEISDLTLELNDLSQEISEGVSKSAQAVQAAESGIKQIGSLAHERTISMIEERANLPIISLQPVVSGAAKKTSRVVGQATRTILGIIYRGRSEPLSYEDEEADM